VKPADRPSGPTVIVALSGVTNPRRLSSADKAMLSGPLHAWQRSGFLDRGFPCSQDLPPL